MKAMGKFIQRFREHNLPASRISGTSRSGGAVLGLLASLQSRERVSRLCVIGLDL